MQQTTTLQQQISDALSDIHFPPKPTNLYDPIQYMLQIGGKRVRPLLTLMAADLFSISSMEHAMPAALAIELFHNFSLIHDDIMDGAPLRRGQQTVHERWNNNVAILAGDNLLIMAYEQLSKCEGDKLPRLLTTFNSMATAVCQGQQLDMDFEQRKRVQIDEYIQMIKLKTSVLLGAALKMGAILSNASEKDTKLIYQFGVNVGIAFQLQDDILDVYGDPKHFGKKPGGDILANKKTFLLVKALEICDNETCQQLSRLLDAKNLDPEQKIAQVKALYDTLGIRDLAQANKQAYIVDAFNALEDIDVDDIRKAPLRILAQNLLNREK